MTKEFLRLTKHMDSKPGSGEWNEQYSLTTKSELAARYGAANKLESWQALRRELGIDPLLSIKRCKAVNNSCAFKLSTADSHLIVSDGYTCPYQGLG